MNDTQLDDIKQFIDAKLSQTEVRLATEIKGIKEEVGDSKKATADLRFDMSTLRGEMNDGFAGVAEAIEALNNRLRTRDLAMDKRFKN